MEKQINTKRLEVGDTLVGEYKLEDRFAPRFHIDRVDEIQAYSGEAHFHRTPTNGYYLVEGYSHMPHAEKYVLFTFENQLRYDFIPRIKVMAEKEQAHLQGLEASKKKLSSYFLFGTRCSIDIDDMIKTSNGYLNHFKQRIEDYTKYLKELEENAN